MDMNEIRERRKKRAIKVAITEGLMVVAIAMLVVVATMMTVGYSVRLDEEVAIERTGLVAVQSVPTGATVTVDGAGMFLRTNMRRTVAEGTHEITLTREGYDSWTRTVGVSAGMFYRIEYPRLFLTEKEVEKVGELAVGAKYTIAPDENNMLVANPGENKWEVWRINEDKPVATELKTAGVIGVDENGKAGTVVAGKVETVEFLSWSGNSEKVIAKINGEYVLVNIRKAEESVNLSRTYGMEFAKLEFANDAGSKIWATERGNLREIEVNGGISGVLVEGVESFANNREEVVYVASVGGERKVGTYKEGEKAGTVIAEVRVMGESDEEDIDKDDEAEVFELGAGTKVRVGSAKYYGDDYVMMAAGGKVRVYRGTLPRYGAEETKLEVIYEGETGVEIEAIEARGRGGVIAATNVAGTEAVVFDAERIMVRSENEEDKIEGNVVKFTTSTEMGWVDEFLMYGVEGGRLVVMDFDGENRREIVGEELVAKSAKVSSAGEVRISRNEKWMYFLGEDRGLYRVRIN